MARQLPKRLPNGKRWCLAIHPFRFPGGAVGVRPQAVYSTRRKEVKLLLVGLEDEDKEERRERQEEARIDYVTEMSRCRAGSAYLHA